MGMTMRSLSVLATMLMAPIAAAAAVVTVTITARPSIPSEEPQWKNWAAFTSAVLNSTNRYREEHNASAVSWNGSLAEFASSYVEEGDECEFAHSGGPYGENLAMGYSNVTASIEAWGSERDDYRWGDGGGGGFDEDTGHFTQLVWRDTTDVGCARRLCGDGRGWYLVCEYYPRGNVEGQYDDEVEEMEGPAATAVIPHVWMVVVAVVAALEMLVWV